MSNRYINETSKYTYDFDSPRFSHWSKSFFFFDIGLKK